MDDLPELVLTVAVFQLIVNILEVGDVELSFALDVEEGEVGFPSLL